MIILVCGLPGSGKSYFSSRLAEAINAEYCNSDRVRKELFSKRTYSLSEKAKVYDILLKKMEEAISQKKNLVLDATFHKNTIRDLFIDKSKGDIIFIEVKADENTIKERLKTSRPYSEADHHVYELIKKQWKPLQHPHLKLQSTNDNIETMLQKALQYIKYDKRSDR